MKSIFGSFSTILNANITYITRLCTSGFNRKTFDVVQNTKSVKTKKHRWLNAFALIKAEFTLTKDVQSLICFVLFFTFYDISQKCGWDT